MQKQERGTPSKSEKAEPCDRNRCYFCFKKINIEKWLPTFGLLAQEFATQSEYKAHRLPSYSNVAFLRWDLHIRRNFPDWRKMARCL